MNIVSECAGTRKTHCLQLMRLLSQCYYAFIIVAYMKVEASGDYYIAWGSEEGAANENCMIYLQFVLWYNKGV